MSFKDRVHEIIRSFDIEMNVADEVVRALERDPLWSVFLDADKILQEKGDTYRVGGVSVWELMSVDALFYAAIYKLERARVTTNLNKRIDDLLDAINYARYVVMRLRNET